MFMLQDLIVMENASNAQYDFAIIKGTKSRKIQMEIINHK